MMHTITPLLQAVKLQVAPAAAAAAAPPPPPAAAVNFLCNFVPLHEPHPPACAVLVLGCRFMFFVSYIARMDVLFEASFSPLSSSGETVCALVLGEGGGLATHNSAK
jgi:hypothetical protein